MDWMKRIDLEEQNLKTDIKKALEKSSVKPKVFKEGKIGYYSLSHVDKESTASLPRRSHDLIWGRIIDDSAKRGPTIFWELFTMISFALKHLKR